MTTQCSAAEGWWSRLFLLPLLQCCRIPTHKREEDTLFLPVPPDLVDADPPHQILLTTNTTIDPSPNSCWTVRTNEERVIVAVTVKCDAMVASIAAIYCNATIVPLSHAIDNVVFNNPNNGTWYHFIPFLSINPNIALGSKVRQGKGAGVQCFLLFEALRFESEAHASHAMTAIFPQCRGRLMGSRHDRTRPIKIVSFHIKYNNRSYVTW